MAATLSLKCVAFSLQWLLLWSMGFRACGLRRRSTRAQHMGSSQTRIKPTSPALAGIINGSPGRSRCFIFKLISVCNRDRSKNCIYCEILLRRRGFPLHFPFSGAPCHDCRVGPCVHIPACYQGKVLNPCLGDG